MNEYWIAVADKRTAKTWKNTKITWRQLCDKCGKSIRTSETIGEYTAMSRDEQSRIKDVGGFVGGYLEGGSRKAESVKSRSLLTLDIDNGERGCWEDIEMAVDGMACLCYSTHKHTEDRPRMRLVIPLSREASSGEYEAVGRMLASEIGMDMLDDTTYEPSRLMFWPSSPKDIEPFYRSLDGSPLDVDGYLAKYKDWRDTTSWPVSSRERVVVKNDLKKLGDPSEKPGYIGAFCEVYSIDDAICTFLSDIYKSTKMESRYTYINGSTWGGAVVYNDGKYLYSNHSTDPARGHAQNAFDLVRIHKFGKYDEDVQEGTSPEKMPSFKHMVGLCEKDVKVCREMSERRLSNADSDFAEIPEEDKDDMIDVYSRLDTYKDGRVKPTRSNAYIILSGDPNLRKSFYKDIFARRMMLAGPTPWRTPKVRADYVWTNDDDSSMRCYVENKYMFSGKDALTDSINDYIVREGLQRHPIRDFLNQFSWDGVNRLDTLFIDYLGVEDTPLFRQCTRKAIVACVARVFDPGCKWDYVLTLVGEEGKGKSTIFKKLGKEWFSDSFDILSGKDMMEQLNGKWIIELAELSAYKKSESEMMKAFLSKQDDRYRAAYAVRDETYYRQCVFFATTNETSFLKGDTGNRRWWPMRIGVNQPKYNVWDDLTEGMVGQIWAEAVQRYKDGEELYLKKEYEMEMRKIQVDFNELSDDERVGILQGYLDTKLPSNWSERDIPSRRAWFQNCGNQTEIEAGCDERRKVCAAEILTECFGIRLEEINTYRSKEIAALMRRIPGWKRAENMARFKLYGVTRYWEIMDEKSCNKRV